jgi:hypothetical protein
MTARTVFAFTLPGTRQMITEDDVLAPASFVAIRPHDRTFRRDTG